MSEPIIEKGKSGEYWRVTIDATSEIYDHEPTPGDIRILRESMRAQRQRAANERLMRVSDRPGRIDGGFEVKRA
jgi:hypothetical protein